MRGQRPHAGARGKAGGGQGPAGLDHGGAAEGRHRVRPAGCGRHRHHRRGRVVPGDSPAWGTGCPLRGGGLRRRRGGPEGERKSQESACRSGLFGGRGLVGYGGQGDRRRPGRRDGNKGELTGKCGGGAGGAVSLSRRRHPGSYRWR